MINLEMPTVSVIIPIYNVDGYLTACLDSLINQSLQQIEILCIDDQSTDNSVDTVLLYQNKDNRVRLLKQKHSGVSAARNLGIANAKGKYIAFIDGDDWAERDMLQKMVEKAEQTDSDVIICSAKVHFNADSFSQKCRLKSLQTALTADNQICTVHSGMDRWELLAKPGSWPFIWNKLIRSDIIKNNGIGFSEKLSLGEDGEFLQILFQYVHKVAFIENSLYNYRYQRNNSATVRLYDDRIIRFEKHIDVINELLSELDSRALLKQNRISLLKWVIDFLYYDFVHLPKTGRSSISQKIYNVLDAYELLSDQDALNGIEKNRLYNMISSDKECTNAKRAYDIARLKLEGIAFRLK